MLLHTYIELHLVADIGANGRISAGTIAAIVIVSAVVIAIVGVIITVIIFIVRRASQGKHKTQLQHMYFQHMVNYLQNSGNNLLFQM